jgi:hypothetical protein
VRRRRFLLGLAVVVAPVVALACSHSLAFPDWVAQANALCQQAQQDADAHPAPPSPLPGDVLRLTATRSQTELDQLKALDPPDDRKTAVSQYLISLGHRIDALNLYAGALDKAPTGGTPPDRTALEQDTTDSFDQAQALGLDGCSGGIDFTVDTTTTTIDAGPTTAPMPTSVGGQPENEDNTPDAPG